MVTTNLQWLPFKTLVVNLNFGSFCILLYCSNKKYNIILEKYRNAFWIGSERETVQIPLTNLI